MDFGVKDDLIERIKKLNTLPSRGVTLERCLLKYGEECGKQKWEGYCQKQRESNEFEYKKAKFGMSKDEFDRYNKSRASTLENFKLRHGDDGADKWEKYKSRQAFTKSKEYYISLFGEVAGTQKFNQLSILKSNSKKAFLLKYGEEEGLFRYNEFVKSGFYTYSKSSQECFDTILLLLTPEERVTTFYATFNYEETIDTFQVDFLVKKLKLIIEYQGDYWHCNPSIMSESQKIKNGMMAKDIWQKDLSRKEKLELLGFNVIYIWESNWAQNRQTVLDSIEGVISELRNKILENNGI